MIRRSRNWGSRIALAAALTLCGTSVASIASAAPNASDIATAKQALKDGRAARKAGNQTAALEQFLGAYALVPTPITGHEVAQSQVDTGKLTEALDTCRKVVAMPVGANETNEHADARKACDELTRSLPPRIPRLSIKLDNTPKGVEPKVTLDGVDVPLGALALPRLIDPGKHEVFVRMDGQAPKKAVVDLAEGQTRVVNVDLTPDVPLDTPKTPTPPPTPSTSEAAPKPPTTPPATPRAEVAASSGGSKTLAWVGFAVGGVGLITGSVTGILELGKAGTVKDNCPNRVCPPAFHDDLDAMKRYGTISTVGFGVAIVGIGVGIWGLVASPAPAATETRKPVGASVQPWIGVGSVGVTGVF
jgi:hypothetical protein